MYVKAIIFDMDGVLVDSMPFHYEAWRETLESLGIQVPEVDIYRREGEKGEITAGDYLEKAGIEQSEEKIKRLLRQKEQRFKKISHPRLFPDTERIVLTLKKEGYLLGLVTGTSYDEVVKVLPGTIASCFNAMITGDRVRNGKPHPEPYLKALEKLGVTGNEAIVIENAPYGIKSARAAGIYCIALMSYLDKEHLKEANLLISTLKELPETIKKLEWRLRR